MECRWIKNKIHFAIRNKICVTAFTMCLIYFFLNFPLTGVYQYLSKQKILRSTSGTNETLSKQNRLESYETFQDKTMNLSEKRTPPPDATTQRKHKLLLVLCTSFDYSEKRERVHYNTMLNWPLLGASIQPVLFIDNTSLTKKFKEHGWHVYSAETTRIEGLKTPVIKQMFIKIQQQYDSHFVGFVNADILLDLGLYKTINYIKDFVSYGIKERHLLIVGRRRDVTDISEIRGSKMDTISKIAKMKGKLHPPYGIDLFITDHNYPWYSLPELVIGRPQYDNWLIMRAHKHGHVIIDITKTVTILHQQVDMGSRGDKYDDRGELYLNKRLIYLYYNNINWVVGNIICASHQTVLNSTSIEIHVRKVSQQCHHDYYNKYD